MKRVLISATAILIAGAAVAQQSSTGQSSGGPAVQRSGPTAPAITGSIVIPAEQRSVIRQRFTAPPVTTLRDRVTVGMTVPAEVELALVPEAVVTEPPAVRGFRYFRWSDDDAAPVVLASDRYRQRPADARDFLARG
jgi:hypothetical protein